MCSYRRMRGLISEEVRDTKLFFVAFHIQLILCRILSHFACFTGST